MRPFSGIVVALSTIERRAGERVAMDARLICRVPASPVKGKILDLTHYGCRVGFAAQIMEVGGTITLELENGDRVSGEVVWYQASQVGVRFHRRLKSGTAVFLGIEEPSAPLAEAQAEIDPSGVGAISHWFRRLGKRFSAGGR